MKYVIAYRVPPHVDQVVRDNYFRVTGRDLSTYNFHVSLMYPFHLKESSSERWILQQIKSIGFESITARLTQIGVYQQRGKVLYIGVEPSSEFYKIHIKLLRGLRMGIQIDTRPFLGGELPKFSPHISIEYDFDGDEVVLSSLRLEKFDAHFDTGLPRLYKYDFEKGIDFTEVT